jgi:hypothetical protein
MKSLIHAFLLVAALASSLCAAPLLYPNPFQENRGHTSITLDNVSDNVRLSVFKINGALVYEGTFTAAAGKATWDVRNADGREIAPGLYLYKIKNSDGGITKGKLLIIR